MFTNQSQIDDFQTNYPNCTHIEGDVTIGNGYLTDITNLNGLSVLTIIDGDLFFDDNDVLTSFSGLDALMTIGGDLNVYDTELITNFSGLGALETINGSFMLAENNQLTSFTGLTSLDTIFGMFEVGHNLILSSFNGLQSLTHTGGFEIAYVHNMQDLSGLSALNSIGGFFHITSCHNLTSLSGLNSLTTVGGTLNINGNPILENVAGLDALISVGGQFGLGNNTNISSLANLNSLTTVASDFNIGGCDMLPDLSGLEALTTIGGELRIGGNSILTSLQGIDNINPSSITNLNITYNPQLSTCEVNSICDYLISPGGQIFLFSNAPGCNSQIEVENSCGTGINNHEYQVSFSIYPNPAENTITINIQDKIAIKSLCIYNRLGQKVLTANPANNTINVSELETGMYFVELTTLKAKARQKLIIE